MPDASLTRRDLQKLSDLALSETWNLSVNHTRHLRRNSSRSARSLRPTPPPPEEAAHSPNQLQIKIVEDVPKDTADRSDVPADSSDIPADSSEDPTDKSKVPTDRWKVPADREELPELVLPAGRVLCRHSSDTRLLAAVPAPVPAAHQSEIAAVLDRLYVGTSSAARQQWLLCRLAVVAVVELSEVRPDPTGPPDCPCVCPRLQTHHRQQLRINIRDDAAEDLRPFLAQINRFIDAHRRRGSVLVHSTAGRSRAPTILLQYMMAREGMTLVAASERVSHCWPLAQPNQGFFRLLVALDKERRSGATVAEAAAVSKAAASSTGLGRFNVKGAWY